jgi:hypothetical protein
MDQLEHGHPGRQIEADRAGELPDAMDGKRRFEVCDGGPQRRTGGRAGWPIGPIHTQRKEALGKRYRRDQHAVDM